MPERHDHAVPPPGAERILDFAAEPILARSTHAHQAERLCAADAAVAAVPVKPWPSSSILHLDRPPARAIVTLARARLRVLDDVADGFLHDPEDVDLRFRSRTSVVDVRDLGHERRSHRCSPTRLTMPSIVLDSPTLSS